MLLRKFDTLSKKEMKMIKTQISLWKTAKKCLKNVLKHLVIRLGLGVRVRLG